MRQTTSAALAAKALREALARHFPGIKFSVNSKNYSGGSSINVRWNDGPNASQVEAIADLFQYSDFDGMTDSTSFRGEAILDGEKIANRAGYVFCNRELSDKVLARHIASVVAMWRVEPITVADYHKGLSYGWRSNDGYDLGRTLSDRLNKHSDRL